MIERAEPVRQPFDDPRQRGFRARASFESAVELIDRRTAALPAESVALHEAAGRVLATDAISEHAFPPFDRAAMDGFAIRGEETFSAETYAPAAFRLIGRSRPGHRFGRTVGPGQAVEIATGAPMPAGADAVVPVEVAACQDDRVSVVEPCPPGRHVGRMGEDFPAGATLLQRGRVLRPQDLGVLSAAGRPTVPVVARPIVALIVTGNELLPVGSPAAGDRFADMNSVMLAALVARDGGVCQVRGPLWDDRETLARELVRAGAESHLVLISGGSSTGPEDHAPSVLAALGTLDLHGMAIRPAGPTGLGFLGQTPVVLLPGNPVSCLCAYDLFAGRIVRRLGGRPPEWPYRSVDRPLGQKLVSAIGRLDYARVRLECGLVRPMAIGGASILSSTTRADGFVLVAADLEGYPAGAMVRVWLYD